MDNFMNRFQNIIEDTANILAPSPPLFVDFVYNWERFAKTIEKLSVDEKNAIEFTHLPNFLENIINILVSEDLELKNQENPPVGRCMEHLFGNNLLNYLADSVVNEESFAVKVYVFQFFSKFLTALSNPNLAYSAVYVPLMKLMNVAVESQHSDCELAKTHLLSSICAAVCKQPSVALLFFSDSNVKGSSTIENNVDLMNSVLQHINSDNDAVHVKSCQSVLLLCSIKNDNIGKYISNRTILHQLIDMRLRTLFHELILESSNEIDYNNIYVSWCFDTVPDKKHRGTILFFSWLDYLTQLTSESNNEIRTKIQDIFNTFLLASFAIDLLSNVVVIDILRKVNSIIGSSPLAPSFNMLILRVHYSSSMDSDTIHSKQNLSVLIENLNRDQKLACSTLQLFIDLLEKFDSEILHQLLLQYLNERLYFDTEEIASSWSDEEDERQKNSSTVSSVCSRTLAPSNVDRIINCFNSIIPSQLFRGNSKSEEHKVDKLQTKYKATMKQCQKYYWPSEATLKSSSNVENFHEGPFLKAVFEMLRNSVDVDCPRLILVSEVIKTMAIIPHPYLHEYLLNPFLPLKNGVDSLFSSLQCAAECILHEVQKIENYRILLKNRTVQMVRDNDRNADESFLDRCVIIEDLCRELATIAYVKYKNSC